MIAADARCPLDGAPATETCGRCGRFVCITCQRLRETDVFCEACVALVPERRPLRGWVLLAGVNLLIAPVAFLMAAGRLWTQLRDQSLELLDGSVGGWFGGSLIEVFSTGVVAVIAVIVVPRYLGRRRSAVRWAKVFFFATVVASVLSRWALVKAQLPVPALLEWNLATSPMWLVFFEGSKTVSDTFVR